MTDTQVVAEWYNQNAVLEHNRLNACRLEFSVSLRVINQCLEQLRQRHDRPLRILDLGGGTGRYAVELARKGHSVTLADISRSELELAKSFAAESGVTLDAIVEADARAIQVYPKEEHPRSVFTTSTYDFILCQGPMYHLLEDSERTHVLRACASMLRGNGILAVAFVTQYAHLRDIAQRDPARLGKEFDGFYRAYLASGRYTRNPFMASYHTNVEDVRGLFHKVDGLLRTQDGVGLALSRIVACEGFLGGGLAGKLCDLLPDVYERWVDVVMQFVDDEALLGNADHLLAIAETQY
ncbi:S-adenosyl-L-methionine-dependent methyltransferase [Aspergillus pseudotamarii]|uniref:S-adenosyl-L-methionine-dependent methyltransferase n=1 Tax=Aspergillus pseudotamarii TaxID=132259 RepID=A0A5N6SZY5_ASPPS|nr:S-adenosyl-L-methionine-dependent methyltransferase [Aspergillus pseudotamarii]KAE8140205.1 S-adenosyl-L-methionine-dependent methyltransferase [Aspergillus pseudotamarii]